jgi:outer membrane protein TolC
MWTAPGVLYHRGMLSYRSLPLIIALPVILLTTAARVAAAEAGPLTLEQCVARALATAPTIEVARAGADFSEAQMREASSALYPSLRTDIDYLQQPGYNQAITNRGQSSGQAIADYLAIDGGRRLAQVRAANYARLAASLGVAAARSQIILDTASSYFDLVRTQRAQAEISLSLERMTRFAATIRALAQSGRAIPNDVLKIEVARYETELASNSASQARRRSSLLLASFIGDFGREDLQVAPPPDSPEPVSEDLSRNPTLLAMRTQRHGARATVGAAEAERYPTLRIGLTGGFLGIDPPAGVTRDGGASYGGVLSMPVFDGGAISARVDQAKAREHAAAAQVRQVELELTRRLAASRSRYREAREALKVLAEATPAAEDSFALAWSRFLGGGNVTLLEVLDNYRQAQALRLGRLDQEFNARQAAAETAQILGIDL